MEIAARTLQTRYLERVDQARAYDAYSEPPGRSQWGRLKQLASDHRDAPDTLMAALTDASDGALRDRASSGWNVRYGTHPSETLGAWLRTELLQASGDLPELVGLLASQMLRGEEQGDSASARAGRTQ